MIIPQQLHHDINTKSSFIIGTSSGDLKTPYPSKKNVHINYKRLHSKRYILSNININYHSFDHNNKEDNVQELLASKTMPSLRYISYKTNMNSFSSLFSKKIIHNTDITLNKDNISNILHENYLNYLDQQYSSIIGNLLHSEIKELYIRINKQYKSNDPRILCWTEKYFPLDNIDLYDNYENVKIIENFLKYGSNTLPLIKDNIINNDDFIVNDDSSDDDEYETEIRPNTLLLFGPTSSGKSASVYLAANKCNMKVIEFSSNTNRTGSLMTKWCKEATQSHRVTGTKNHFFQLPK